MHAAIRTPVKQRSNHPADFEGSASKHESSHQATLAWIVVENPLHVAAESNVIPVEKIGNNEGSLE